ncbi:hypothetical protein SGRIM128S_03014 [Streptomyces griseomycini]
MTAGEQFGLEPAQCRSCSPTGRGRPVHVHGLDTAQQYGLGSEQQGIPSTTIRGRKNGGGEWARWVFLQKVRRMHAGEPPPLPLIPSRTGASTKRINDRHGVGRHRPRVIAPLSAASARSRVRTRCVSCVARGSTWSSPCSAGPEGLGAPGHGRARRRLISDFTDGTSGGLDADADFVGMVRSATPGTAGRLRRRPAIGPPLPGRCPGGRSPRCRPVPRRRPERSALASPETGNGSRGGTRPRDRLTRSEGSAPLGTGRRTVTPVPCGPSGAGPRPRPPTARTAVPRPRRPPCARGRRRRDRTGGGAVAR